MVPFDEVMDGICDMDLMFFLGCDRFGDADADDVQVSLVNHGKQVLGYATEHSRNAGIDKLEASGVNVMTSTSVVEVLLGDKKEGEMKQHN